MPSWMDTDKLASLRVHLSTVWLRPSVEGQPRIRRPARLSASDASPLLHVHDLEGGRMVTSQLHSLLLLPAALGIPGLLCFQRLNRSCTPGLRAPWKVLRTGSLALNGPL